MSVETTTQKREYGTDFSHWLRAQPSIDSHNESMSITNLDYVIEGPYLGKKFYSPWGHKNVEGKGLWMIVEEKTHGAIIKQWQGIAFTRIAKLCKADPAFRGFHFLRFENTSPSNGLIWLDGKEILTNKLIEFLRFEAPLDCYRDWLFP